MIVAGIDAGQQTTKVVITEDSKILSAVTLRARGKSAIQVGEEALSQAAEKADLSVDDIEYSVATGSRRRYLLFAKQQEVDVICLARGASLLFPSARTVVDIGAERALALRCADGEPLDFASNEKCASGSGIYLETAAKIMHVGVEESGELSLQSKEEFTITSSCPVFAESEIVSLVHMQKQLADILSAVYSGVALRTYSLLMKVGLEKDVVMVGGVARNIGMVKAIEKQIGFDLLIPGNPEIVAALGAAFCALQAGQSNKGNTEAS